MYVTYQKNIYISQMNVLTLNLDGKCCDTILELASFSTFEWQCLILKGWNAQWWETSSAIYFQSFKILRSCHTLWFSRLLWTFSSRIHKHRWLLRYITPVNLLFGLMTRPIWCVTLACLNISAMWYIMFNWNNETEITKTLHV